VTTVPLPAHQGRDDDLQPVGVLQGAAYKPLSQQEGVILQ